MLIHHVGSVEVFINGRRVAKKTAPTPGYRLVAFDTPVTKLFKPGSGNTLSVHCQGRSEEHYVDVGLVTVRPRK